MEIDFVLNNLKEYNLYFDLKTRFKKSFLDLNIRSLMNNSKEYNLKQKFAENIGKFIKPYFSKYRSSNTDFRDFFKSHGLAFKANDKYREDPLLDEFIEYLKIHYFRPLSEISKTNHGRSFIMDDFKMISMDELAWDYPVRAYSSVDAIHVNKTPKGYEFNLIEFKKMDLDNPNSLAISLSYFKKTRNKIKCKKGCKFLKTYDRSKTYLADKTKVGLRIKPLSTLNLLENLFNEFRILHREVPDLNLNERIDFLGNDEVDMETLETFSRIKFNYIIVYLKSRRKSGKNKFQREQYFDFLDSLVPFPIANAYYCDNEYFENHFLKEYKKDCGF